MPHVTPEDAIRVLFLFCFLPKCLLKVKQLGKRHLPTKCRHFTSENKEFVGFVVNSPSNTLHTCFDVLPLTKGPSERSPQLLEKALRVLCQWYGNQREGLNKHKSDSHYTGDDALLEGEKHSDRRLLCCLIHQFILQKGAHMRVPGGQTVSLHYYGASGKDPRSEPTPGTF